MSKAKRAPAPTAALAPTAAPVPPIVSAAKTVDRSTKPSFVGHVHALLVTSRSLRLATTWGVGLVALVLVGVLIVTGVLLGLHYVPSGNEAYGSVLDLEYAVPFGQTLRALHRWASDALLVVVGLHTVRIVLTAAYNRRAVNWLIGLGLGGVLLLSAFSGYVLPWDQRAYWAARVVSGLLTYVPWIGPLTVRLFFGASELGSAGLGRVHALHVTALPMLLVGLVVVHLWRVRRDGGLASSTSAPRDELLPARPHLFARELIVALLVLVALLTVAVFFPAPLGPLADLTRPANSEKAPWYFLGLQELASRAVVPGALTVPVLLLAVLVLVPFVDTSDADVGCYSTNHRQRWLVVAAAFVSAGAVTGAYALADSRVGLASAPLLVTLGVSVLAPALTWRIWGRRTALQLVLVALTVALLVFTVVGACRGANWIFAWPWQGETRAS